MAEDVFPKPSVGRIVHYRNALYEDQNALYKDQKRCLAALITEVIWDGPNPKVTMTVFYPNGGMADHHNVHFGANDMLTNCWHWPERV